MTTQITNSKKIIAFTDSINECECCGKKELKGTFCVEIDGKEFYFGSTCTFKKHGFDKKDVNKKISDYNYDFQNCERKTGRILRETYGTGNFTEKMFDELFIKLWAEYPKRAY